MAGATWNVNVFISERVLDKLANRHRVTPEEIQQCFESREGRFLRDTREQHATSPPTLWFVGKTNRLRKLKVVFILRVTDGEKRVHIRTAYEPSLEVIRLYERIVQVSV